MAALEEKIRAILLSPETDLTRISAKRVRKALAQEVGADFVKENREEVDELITRVFNQVNEGSAEGEEPEESNGKRKRSEEPEEDGEEGGDASEEEEEEETPPPKKKAKGKPKSKSTEESDAELARQLELELNGRPRAARSAAKPKVKATRGKKGKKSADFVEDSDEEEGEGGKKKTKAKAKRKSAGGGGAKGGFAKEYILSEPLAAVLAVDKLSRPQVVKKMWEYIREHDLQNPSDKREILCDDKLRAVFNAPSTNMFKMNKTLSLHLIDQ